MGIVVENTDSVERLNTLLHEYGSYIIGHAWVFPIERAISTLCPSPLMRRRM